MSEGNSFNSARRETVRLHEALYAAHDPARPRGWVARPHPLVIDAVGRLTAEGPVQAYDLGCGVGRHASFLAENLPDGSRVIAVDLVPAALTHLMADVARRGLEDRVTPVLGDVQGHCFARGDAGVVVAFSVLEHLSCPQAIGELLTRCREATIVGGVNVLAIFADRVEMLDDGSCRPGVVECPLTACAAEALVRDVYQGWEVEVVTRATTVREERAGEVFDLRSTMVGMIAVRGDR